MEVTLSIRQAAKSHFGSPAALTSLADFLLPSPLPRYQLVYENSVGKSKRAKLRKVRGKTQMKKWKDKVAAPK